MFRPCLIVPSKSFQVVFVHLVYNSALFLPSCCCLFLLHVVAKFTCIFLVSCQLVLLSARPKFLCCFCGQKRVYAAVLLKNFNPIDANRFSSFFLRVQISLPYKRMGESQCIIYFVLGKFCTKVSLTRRLLMSYIYGAPILDVSRSHTTTQHSR